MGALVETFSCFLVETQPFESVLDILVLVLPMVPQPADMAPGSIVLQLPLAERNGRPVTRWGCQRDEAGMPASLQQCGCDGMDRCRSWGCAPHTATHSASPIHPQTLTPEGDSTPAPSPCAALQDSIRMLGVQHVGEGVLTARPL